MKRSAAYLVFFFPIVCVVAGLCQNKAADLLFDHFHDIMPGSGIALSYLDAKRNLENVDRAANDLTFTSLGETDLMERPLGNLPVSNGEIKVPTKPYEIKTIEVRFSDMSGAAEDRK